MQYQLPGDRLFHMNRLITHPNAPSMVLNCIVALYFPMLKATVSTSLQHFSDSCPSAQIISLINSSAQLQAADWQEPLGLDLTDYVVAVPR